MPVSVFLIIFGVINIFMLPYVMINRAKKMGIKLTEIEPTDLFSLFSFEELNYLPLFSCLGFLFIMFSLMQIIVQ